MNVVIPPVTVIAEDTGHVPGPWYINCALGRPAAKPAPDTQKLTAERNDARHCLMLMIQRHRSWVFDTEGTDGQKAEMELARVAALADTQSNGIVVKPDHAALLARIAELEAEQEDTAFLATQVEELEAALNEIAELVAAENALRDVL